MHKLRPYFPPPVSRLLLIASGAALFACVQAEPANEADNGEPEEPALNLPAVPLPEPSLDRSGLLAAVALAASATAAGADDRRAQRDLDGRQFELRIRFGCRGPTEDLRDHSLSWGQDRETGTLRVRALPTLTGDDPVAAEIGGGAFEAVEGFWVPRPWLLDPACPRTAALIQPAASDAAKAPATGAGQAAANADGEPDQSGEESTARPASVGPKIGIAQFFTPTDPRTRRRDNRAYESVTNVKPGQPLGTQGFNLVLSGRLRALPGRSVINCTPRGPEAPPDCIVSAEFDRVWIERPDTREILAEWGSG